MTDSGLAVLVVAPGPVPMVHLLNRYRLRNTYYRGLYADGDVQPRELPMTPEISVISTVRLYFKSPAAVGKKKAAPAHQKKRQP